MPKPVFSDIDVCSCEQLVSQTEYVSFFSKLEKHLERIIIDEILRVIKEDRPICSLECA
jgi:hypothetical protein